MERFCLSILAVIAKIPIFISNFFPIIFPKMATATAILNEKYLSKDGYQVGIRLIDGKAQRFKPSGYKIPSKYWDEKAEQVSDEHPDADIINSVLEDDLVTAKRYFRDCRLSGMPIDLDLVFKEIKSHLWTDYLRHRAAQHKEADQIEMEYKCGRYAKEFTWCFGRDVYFSELTPENIRKYDSWLSREDSSIDKKKNGPNTRKKKFEFLGKYWNNAKREGKVFGDINPFEDYKINGTPVKKDKLTRDQITALEDLPLIEPRLMLARDLFLFSYYCKGVRFETCITAKKSAIANGRIYLQANKGKQFISILIHPKLQAIIDRYKDNKTDTIFGRVNTKEIDMVKAKRSKIGSENTMINGLLKDVAALAEIPIPLSMHHARHTLAFHLKQVTENIHVIKEALGHSRTQITETYLNALDDEAIDNQMAKVYDRKIHIK
jgi:integrase/recombinase XerD